MTVSPIDDRSSSIFSVYWLDKDVNLADESKKTCQKLHAIIQNLTTFDDVHKCQSSIKLLTASDRLILIVSGSFGRQIVPIIHDLQQVSCIYVYCLNKELNEQWSCQYRKIKSVIIREGDLIDRIKFDSRKLVDLEERLLKHIYTITDEPNKSISTLNHIFNNSLVLIKNIIRFEYDQRDWQQLISLLRKAYKGNLSQLQIIDQFKNTYTKDTALLWYIHEPILYQMLKKILREENIDEMLLFRFFLRDIYQQLKQNQYGTRIRVYHSEIMTKNEIEALEKSKYSYISTKAFLWTTINQNNVLECLASIPIQKDELKVLYIIDANPNVAGRTPFADISRFYGFLNETQIMFMIGSIFRINDIQQDENTWKIHLELCGDTQDDLVHVFDYIKSMDRTNNEENTIDRQTFGEITYRMELFTLSEQIVLRVYDDNSDNDELRIKACRSLGKIYQMQKKYKLSLSWFEQALKIFTKMSTPNRLDVGDLHGYLADVYSSISKNSRKSLTNYQKAIKYYTEANAEYNPKMANFYNNMAAIYRTDKKFRESLEYYKKALEIDQYNLRVDNQNVAKSHNDIAIVYAFLNDYCHALEHYQLSLAIKMKILDPDHISIAYVYRNIGVVLEAQGNFRQAAINYRKAAEIFHNVLPSRHEDVIRIDSELTNALNHIEH